MKNQDLLFVAQQTNMVKQAISAGGVAEGIGYMLPGVGTALSARDAAQAFGQGRIMAGLGNTAMAGLSLIPGGGLAGGALKGIGRFAGMGLRALKGTRAGAKAVGAGAAIGKAMPSFVQGGKAVGQAAVNTGKAVGTQYGKLSEGFANTGVGSVLKNNPIKATAGAIGANALSKPAPVAGAADDAAMSHIGNLAESAQQSTPNPMFASPSQPSWGNGESAMPSGLLGQA